MKNNFNKMSFDQQNEAMTIICNIRMMQEKTFGEAFPFKSFQSNTIEELRNLQEIAIKEYNKTFVK